LDGRPKPETFNFQQDNCDKGVDLSQSGVDGGI